MPQQVFVQVRFQEKTEVGEFNDALYFTQAQFNALTQAQIDTMKSARVTNWVNAIKNPPPPQEPTKEVFEAAIASLENQKKAYQDEITKLEGKK